MVAFWCPTWRVTLWHVGYVSATCLSCPFRFLKSVYALSQCNYAQYGPYTDSGKVGQSFETKLWVGFSSAEWDMEWWGQGIRPVGAAWEQVPVLYEKKQPTLACHKFWTQMLSCFIVRMNKGMVHTWVAQKLLNVTFYEFLRCLIC